MPAIGKTILIINDEQNKAAALERLLKNEPGLHCDIITLEEFTKKSLRATLADCAEKGFPVSVIISDDVISNDLNGLTVANIAQESPDKPAVLIKTSWQSPGAAMQNHPMIKGFFNQSSRFSDLTKAVKSILAKGTQQSLER
ncbi:MAG: hypothetical protein SFW63_08615 [Alphaproteobacteria bacterium]|nr:hypothetical protein [Alphaproteobacteria bacterium]